ncbi:MAG: hypothetical protein GEU74_14830 [Nitriliruptorales bacterium]|nr:hypothetical protein [Nitriliruptorales bacterium]
MVTVLAGCADDEPTTGQPHTSEPDTVATSPATTGPEAGDTSENEPANDDRNGDVEVIEVRITDGQAHTDNSRVDVAVGATVRIEVRADVDEEVHVHGYDLFAEVSRGDPAVVEFAADIPGVFEVEAEHSGVELFQLRVR